MGFNAYVKILLTKVLALANVGYISKRRCDMTAKQLSVMLSGLEDNEVAIKFNNKELIFNGIEIGVDSNTGKVFLIAESK